MPVRAVSGRRAKQPSGVYCLTLKALPRHRQHDPGCDRPAQEPEKFLGPFILLDILGLMVHGSHQVEYVSPKVLGHGVVSQGFLDKVERLVEST